MPSASGPAGPSIDAAFAAGALAAGLKDEFGRAGFRRAVLGLSGGIDSAVALLLAARAFGPSEVIALALPVGATSPESLAHARLAAEAARVPLRVLDLGPALAAAESALPGAAADRTRRGNLAARLRMAALYDASAAERALVVGTSNKTELLLGYGTLHGDMASAVNPLGDLYKTEVRALARHLGVPREIVEKAPTADLWPGQTDEGELGFSYEEADRVLHQWLDLRRRPADIVAAGADPALVDRLRARVLGTSFKRRPPLILKLGIRTIGVEFRLPRDAGS
jgi:NAD+ synthase